MMINHPAGWRHWTHRKPELLKRGTESHAAKLSARAKGMLHFCDDVKQYFALGRHETAFGGIIKGVGVLVTLPTPQP